MIFDNFEQMQAIDKSNMLRDIQTLPDQLAEAWQLANNYELPENRNLENILIAGMGGSAIGADMLTSYTFPLGKKPVYVIRGYSLPLWAKGPENLVVCSSHSGNTEETLSVFQEAENNGCTVLVVSRGGLLKDQAEKHKSIFWQFEHTGQPRSAVGYSFGMLLNLFSRMSFIPDQTDILRSTIEKMKEAVKKIDADVPVSNNLAKRIAGQAFDRQPVILGAEHLEPIARRWKTQINEIAKGWSGFEFLPEANHNTLAGLENPEKVLGNLYAIFLASDNYNPRNQKRFFLTFDQFMISGLCTDKIEYKANNKLSEIWQFLLLGDFVSYYLAMMYGVDPTPIEALEEFKKSMKN